MAPRTRWTEDETKRALYLYFQTPFGRMHSGNPEIIALANGTGRTPSSIAMKLLARWDRRDGSIGPRFVRHGRQKSWSFEDAIALLAKRLRAMEPGWGACGARRAGRDKGAAAG